MGIDILNYWPRGSPDHRSQEPVPPDWTISRRVLVSLPGSFVLPIEYLSEKRVTIVNIETNLGGKTVAWPIIRYRWRNLLPTPVNRNRRQLCLQLYIFSCTSFSWYDLPDTNGVFRRPRCSNFPGVSGVATFSQASMLRTEFIRD